MMLNTKKRPLIAAALLLTSFGITTSCIDNSYDLNKDIDMTISAGGEHLAIPVGYTEKITLDKIIELDEGDDLQIVDGEYHLLKKDNIDETNTSVGTVTVAESENIIDAITLLVSGATARVSNAQSEGKINAEAHNVDKAVIEIGSLAADMPTTLTLKLELGDEISTSLVEVGTMTINFPDFIQFEKENGLNGQTLTMTNVQIRPSGFTKELKINKYVFGSTYGEGNRVEEKEGDRILKIENQKITIEMQDIYVP